MAEAEKVAEAVAVATAAADGSKAAQIKTNFEDKWTRWMRNLAGPAVSGMICTIIAILSFGGLEKVWVIPMGLWTPVSEVARVHYVGGIGIALAVMLGLLLWRSDGSKVGSLEVKVGPGSIKIEDDKP